MFHFIHLYSKHLQILTKLCVCCTFKGLYIDTIMEMKHVIIQQIINLIFSLV